jgi:molybdopterin-guanine dinucleotide biosynthesis protein A
MQVQTPEPAIPTTAPLGVILAGGRGLRMGGGDKGLLPLGHGTLLDHVIDRFDPQVAGLALNADGDPARFARFGLPVIADSVPGHAGPLAGVLAGLDWAAGQGATAIVTAAADTPFLPQDLVPRLLLAAKVSGAPIALAATASGRHGTFGLWPVALREDLRAALAGGTRKVTDWADRHGAASAPFTETPWDPFFNVNTPEDLARAQAMAAAG